MRPSSDEYAPYYASYIERVPEDDILGTMEQQGGETVRLLTSIGEERGGYRYAAGKWSIREVAGHLGDAERVFGYRALAVSRGDQTSLPGFDEQEYIRNARYDEWSIRDLAESLSALRRANLLLFRSMNDDVWRRSGIANGVPVTTRALAYMTVGHERHHLSVLKDRYGV